MGWEGIPELDRILGEIAELEHDIKEDKKTLKKLKKKTDGFGETIDVSGHGGFQFVNQRVNDMKGQLNKRKKYVWDWFYRPAGHPIKGPQTPGVHSPGPKPPQGGKPHPPPGDPNVTPPWPMIGQTAVWSGPPTPPPIKRPPNRPPPDKLTPPPTGGPPGSPNYQGSKTGAGPSEWGFRVYPRPPKPPPYIRPGMSPAGALVMPQGSKTGIRRPTGHGPKAPTIPDAIGPSGPQGAKTGGKIRGQGAGKGGPKLSKATAKGFLPKAAGGTGGGGGRGGQKATGGFSRRK